MQGFRQDRAASRAGAAAGHGPRWGARHLKTVGGRLWQGAAFALVAVLALQGCGTSQGHKNPPKSKASSTSKTEVQYVTGPLPALAAVEFPTASLGFLGGQGAVLMSQDGGAQWTRIYQGPQSITALDFLSANQGYALTSQGELMAWSSQGGWSQIAADVPPIVAMGPAGSVPSELLTSQGDLFHRAGGQGPWQKESLGGVIAMSFTDPQNGFAVTGGAATAPELWQTADGGSTWQALYTPKLGTAQGWSAALGASGSDVWLLLTNASGQVEHQPYVAYVSQDGGQHFQEALGAALFAGQGLYPAAPNALYGLQAGPFAVSGPSAYFLSWQPGTPQDVLALSVTADAGQSFSQRTLAGVNHALTPAFFQPLSLTIAPGGTLWLVGSRSGAGTVLFSSDGGVSWQTPAF